MERITRDGRVFFDEDAFKTITTEDIPEELVKAIKEESRPSFSIRALKRMEDIKPVKTDLDLRSLLFSSYDMQNALLTGKYKPKMKTDK